VFVFQQTFVSKASQVDVLKITSDLKEVTIKSYIGHKELQK